MSELEIDPDASEHSAADAGVRTPTEHPHLENLRSDAREIVDDIGVAFVRLLRGIFHLKLKLIVLKKVHPSVSHKTVNSIVDRLLEPFNENIYQDVDVVLKSMEKSLLFSFDPSSIAEGYVQKISNQEIDTVIHQFRCKHPANIR